MFKQPQKNDLNRMIGSSGAIRDLIRFPRSPLDLPLHVVTARVQDDFEAGLSESVARCVASGVSDCNPEIATAAAIGEAWERIAFVQQHDKLMNAPVSSSAPIISKDMLFELPFLLDQGAERDLWAEKAASGPCKMLEYMEFFQAQAPEACELPAWVALQDAESTLFETTNGMACAHSLEVAMDRAVRELVERDALMLVWLARCAGTRVSPERYLSSRQCAQITRLSGMGIQTRLRDVSTEFGISVFVAEIFSEFPNKRLGIAFGAGAHKHPQLAARHAFREAGLSWRGISWRTLTGERPAPQDFTPNSFAEHAEYYSSWDKMHLLDFLLSDDAIEGDDCPDNTGMFPSDYDGGHVELLLEHGRRVFGVDVTPVQAADTGLVVVQAVVPGLVPLYIGDRCADELALRRLPNRLGGRVLEYAGQLNTEVHPWP